MNNYYVYVYANPIDDKIFYVGKGKNNRMYVHLRNSLLLLNNRKNEMIKYILSLDMKPNVYKIEEDLTEIEALEREKYWIAFYGKENLTNLTTGGQGVSGTSHFKGKTHSPETKLKMRNAKLGVLNHRFGKKRLKESLEKFREKMKGENHYYFGKERAEDTKYKISQALKGIFLTEEQKQQRSEIMKGLWFSGDFKRKSFKGSDNPNFKQIDNETLRLIFDLYESGKSIFYISKQVGLSRGKIKNTLL